MSPNQCTTSPKTVGVHSSSSGSLQTVAGVSVGSSVRLIQGTDATNSSGINPRIVQSGNGQQILLSAEQFRELQSTGQISQQKLSNM